MSQVVHWIYCCLSSCNIILLFLKHDYSLLCQKCKYEYTEKGILYSPNSVCSDGVWFCSGEESDVNGLYCCTACIKWFQKYTRGLFQDGTKHKWRRLTHREVCVSPYGQWIESQERTEKFVVHFKKKETEIKKKKIKEKLKGKRKREKHVVKEHVKVPRATTAVKEIDFPGDVPLDVSTVILAQEQSLKNLRNFLAVGRVTPITDQNHISSSVFTVVSVQLDVLQKLVNNLKEHM